MSNKTTITRKIHFFHFDIMELVGSSNKFTTHSNPWEVFKGIGELSFIGNHKKSRFKYYANNDVSFLASVSEKNNGIRGKFALSRRSSLPELERGGVLETLKIPANSGLAEITHFIYYPNKNVIGVEFNFFGPRTNALKNYLLDKSENFKSKFEYIELNPILNQDVDKLLQDMGEVNLFQMEIARNELGIIKELNKDLHSAFEYASKISDAESVEVLLRKKKYSRGGFRFPFSIGKIKDLLSIGDNRQKINKMKVNAESRSVGENKNFDLLEDKMITSKKVTSLGKRSRSVDSDIMFAKIDEAYNELSDNFK